MTNFLSPMHLIRLLPSSVKQRLRNVLRTARVQVTQRPRLRRAALLCLRLFPGLKNRIAMQLYASTPQLAQHHGYRHARIAQGLRRALAEHRNPPQ